jgi:molybdopterin molybdotransferase
MRGFRDRAEVADVLRLIDERVSALPPETVPLADAAGRVLAHDVRADVAVPTFDRAAMDGYALRAAETFGAGPYSPMELTIVGESMPARPFSGRVEPGQAVRIMTGAPVPDGADAVLQAEAAEEANGVLRVTEPVPPLRNIGRRGEDVAPGKTILSAGRILRPQDLGVFSSIGVAQVPVVRRPAVRVVITGDELLPAGSRPEGYRVVDSNSPMLAALVRRDGGTVAAITSVPDNRDAVRTAMLDPSCDVLLISGGTSVGKDDHAPGLLSELGELAVHGLALRPASPAGVGFLVGQASSLPEASAAGWKPAPRSTVVFLLPGNPVSCLCAYDLFAGRAIRRLGGRNTDWPYRVRRLPLAGKIVSAVGRVDYVRVRVVDGRVEPLAVSGASLLSTTVTADGFVLVERDREGHAPGEEVDVWLYDA